ncbi:unnamed protein product [Paramecium sonneborni]|uniref:Uncharacterized protein n=1 Tax=Paramecium sonneborni TaxID=65129 RepID=A0A8S1LZ56_9CILI|nr:unnamed protein product [Paramecium sonneborni]
MHQFKQWLLPIKNFFLSSFSETFQLLLSNFLGDYLEDPRQLNIFALIQGIDKLQLNIKYINQFLGCNPFTFEDAYIQSLKVTNLKLEAEKITIILSLKERSEEELNQYLQNLQEVRQHELAKLNYLQKLRKEMYKRNDQESVNDQLQNSKSQSGLLNFLRLTDTLFSNSSISLKNIEIILKFEQDVQFACLIHGINIELEKADSTNLLFITTIIDLIELKLKNENIALIEKAIKLGMILETSENNKVQLKINAKVSSLDILLNKKQIKILLKQFLNYQSKIDEINKAIIKQQNQKQSIINTSSQIQNKNVFEIKDLASLNNDLSMSLDLNSLSNCQSQEIFQSINIENNQNFQINSNIKDQKETFKCFFQGIKLAICEQTNQFPLERERFFQDLESHFFIEIVDIYTESYQRCFNLYVKRMGAYRIKLNNPPFPFNNRSRSSSISQQNSEIFQSCKPIQKQDFLVTPVVLLGLHQIQKLEYEYSVYNFEQLKEQIDYCQKAINLNIQLLKCKDKKYFYQVNADFSQVIVSFRHESIINLMGYIPQKKIQKLPKNEKNTINLIGLVINIPDLRISYLINEQTPTFTFKQITLKQNPTRAIQLKTCSIETFEEIQYFENPKQFIIITFNLFESKFQNQSIIKIEKQIINEFEQFPTIYLAFKESQPIQLQELIEPEIVFNQKKQLCEKIINFQFPNVKFLLSETFFKWLITLKEYLIKQEKKPKYIKKNQIKDFKNFFQFNINVFSIRIQDDLQDDLIYLKLEKVTAIQAESRMILIQEILAIDCQSPIPQKGDQVYQNFISAQVMLYKVNNEINQTENNIKNDKIRIQTNPMKIDYGKYSIQVYINQNINIKFKNLCLRIPDFKFKTIKKLEPFIQYYREIDEQMQENFLSTAQFIQEYQMEQAEMIIILEKDIFIDVYPMIVVEAFSDLHQLQNQLEYTNYRLILKVNDAKISSVIELNSIDVYFDGQLGIEKQFPLILNGFFDNRPHILQLGAQVQVRNVAYQERNIRIDQIIGNLKYDTIQTIIEFINVISKLIHKDNLNYSETQYEISYDLNQQLIPQQIIEKCYQVNVGQIIIELEQGTTYYETDIIYDDDKLDDQFLSNQNSDKICINLTKCYANIEMYKEGQLGIKYKSNLEINDKISDSCFNLILSSDFEEFNFEDNSPPLQFGLILENQAYTGFVSLLPMRICISGSLLQFIFNFMSNNKKNENIIDQDKIDIIQEIPIIWLKNLKIDQTSFNITYDSSGLNFDGLFKGLLKISSFCNLQIPFNYLEIQCKGDKEYVKYQIIEKISQNFGSKYQIAGKALQSLNAYNQIKSFVLSIKNLFQSTFEDGGLEKSRIELQRSINNAFENLKQIKYGQEILNNITFSSLPSRFLKKY